MTDALSRLLETRDWLMADGATGTNLFNMGLSSGDAPEFWNVDHPDRIKQLYSYAVDAGSDIFLTNTFARHFVGEGRRNHDHAIPTRRSEGGARGATPRM